jgi:uncharacterized protein (TIGR00255 family)
MTGYGDVHRHETDAEYVVELRSVNNRYFKSTFKLPDHLQALEPEIDVMLREKLHRGAIGFALRIRGAGGLPTIEINKAAAGVILAQLHEIAASANCQPQVDLASLMSLPGIAQTAPTDPDAMERVRQLVLEMTDKAIEKVVAMRQHEGAALMRDLLGQCDVIDNHLDTIVERAPQVIVDYRDRLLARIQVLLNANDVPLEPDALAREAALFADRCDITEEVTRLRSHLDQFRETLDAGKSVGRKLDFLAQEMLREANTIGSKASDSKISSRTVDTKSAIDRIKEQLQNIE